MKRCKRDDSLPDARLRRRADVYRQSLMLLVSLVAHAPEPYELVVATDRPECYVWFGTRVRDRHLDAAQLEAWRGPPPILDAQ